MLEDIELEPSAPIDAVARPDVSATAIGLRATAAVRSEGVPAGEIDLAAVPYFTWANRSVEAMRVWIPRSATTGPGAVPAPGDED